MKAIISILFLTLSQTWALTPKSWWSQISPVDSIKVQKLVDSLSPQQLAGQMLMVYHSPTEFLNKYEFGAVLIMQPPLRAPERLQKTLHGYNNSHAIGLIAALDQEGGKVDRMKRLRKDFPVTPAAAEMLSLNTEELSSKIIPVAQEMKKLGINMNLAPVVDPYKNHKGEVTHMGHQNRTFGNTATQIIQGARRFAKMFNSEGVVCVGKHFPGYDVLTDSDREIAISNADSAIIYKRMEIYENLKMDVQGIMMSSVQFSRISHLPAVLDSNLVTAARERSPRGIVITDDLWGYALLKHIAGHKINRRRYPNKYLYKLTHQAVMAGNDMLMISYPAKAVLMQKYISKQLQKDPVFKAKVQRAVYRILMLKKRMKLISGTDKGS